MRVLMKYHKDYGRGGSLDALFVVTGEESLKLKEMESFYLSDILGKHSEVEVYPHLCTIVLVETADTEVFFDILQDIDIGISSEFIGRLHNPQYY